jgi:cell filamentation protein
MVCDVKDYTSRDTIYMYSNTDVFKNKFDIRDLKDLKEQEMFFTSIRITDLQIKPLLGDLTFEHLKKIHKYIFQDIYDFAGETRKVDIEKGNSKFCCSQYIEIEAERIFKKLAEEKHYSEYNFLQYSEKIANFMGDLIALHPFREGNGRANREYLRILCWRNGYELNYNFFSKEEILKADILAFNGDISLLLELINKGLINKIK